MAYTQEWLIENAVIHSTYAGDLSIEDFQESVSNVVAYFDASDRPLVHVLVDNKDVESHPTRLGELNRLTRPMFDHPKMGWLIIYGYTNPVAKFLSKMLAQIFKTRFRMVETYDEAVEFLQWVDTTLSEFPER